MARPAHSLGEETCLALDSAPETCVVVALDIDPDARQGAAAINEITLTARDGQRRLTTVEGIVSERFAVIGNAHLSIGSSWSATTAGTNRSRAHYFSYSTRGIVSHGDARLEYDLTGYSQRTSTGDGRGGHALNGVRRAGSVGQINLLAAGKKLGMRGGTVYGGLFQNDPGMSINGRGTNNLFFVSPSILDTAWKSDGGSMSAFGLTQHAGLLLPSPSTIRIVSRGVQVYEGQLQPGEQEVTFSGYGEPFVDVVMRSATEEEQRQRVQALSTRPDDTPVFDVEHNLHGFYFDASQRVLQNYVDTASTFQRFTVQGNVVASAGYAYAQPWGMARTGVQWGKGFTRLGIGIADRSLSRQLTLMVGTHGERGLSASYQPYLFSGWQPSASFSDYRTREEQPTSLLYGADGYEMSDGCRLLVNSLKCYSSTAHRSLVAGIGHRADPVRLTYKTHALDFSRATLQATTELNWNGLHGSLLNRLSHEPETKAKTLIVSLVVPLEYPGRMASASASNNLDGASAMTASHSPPFAES